MDVPGDVGGQKSLRPFWRNHFEETDALIWVVDSSDRDRLSDCKHELDELLLQEVGSVQPPAALRSLPAYKLASSPT